MGSRDGNVTIKTVGGFRHHAEALQAHVQHTPHTRHGDMRASDRKQPLSTSQWQWETWPRGEPTSTSPRPRMSSLTGGIQMLPSRRKELSRRFSRRTEQTKCVAGQLTCFMLLLALKDLLHPRTVNDVGRGLPVLANLLVAARIYTSDASDVKMYQTADVQLGNVAPNVMFLLTAQLLACKTSSSRRRLGHCNLDRGKCSTLTSTHLWRK